MLYIIAFWHLQDYAPLIRCVSPATLLLTDCVLGLFVFLSGMLLSRRYRLETKGDLVRFYLRRFFRIYPMYFLAALGFFLAGATSAAQFFKGVALMNLLTGSSPRTLWFVEMICLFYWVTPLFLHAYQGFRTFFLGMFLSTALLALSVSSQGMVDRRIGLFLLVFTIGIIWGRSSRDDVCCGEVAPVFFSLLSLAMLFWFRSRIEGAGAFHVEQMAMVLFLPPAFAGADKMARIVDARWIRALSYASFAMYLLHRFVMKGAQILWTPRDPWLQLLVLVCVCLPLTFGLSYIAQKGYDRLLEQLIPDITDRRAKPPGGTQEAVHYRG